MKKIFIAITAMVMMFTAMSCKAKKQTLTVSYGVWETTAEIMASFKDEINKKLGDKYDFKYITADDSVIIEDLLNEKGQTDILLMESGTIGGKFNIPYTPGKIDEYNALFEKTFNQFNNVILTERESGKGLTTYELLWVRKDLGITSIEQLAEYSKKHPLNFGIDLGFWERTNKDGSENVNSGKRWAEHSGVTVGKVQELDSYAIMFDMLAKGQLDAFITMDWANGFKNPNTVCVQLINQHYFAPQEDYFMCRKSVPEDVLQFLKDFRYTFTYKSVFKLEDDDLKDKLY